MSLTICYSYFYVFDWKILSTEAQTFSDPKFTINMNNLQSYDVKKDMRVELVELKKGLFNTTKKTMIKAITLDDLEEWAKIFDKILKKY